MKKVVKWVLITAVVLLVMTLISIQFITIVQANPYVHETIAFPNYLQPPNLKILAPRGGDTIYNSTSNLTVSVKAEIQPAGNVSYWLYAISYQPSWLNESFLCWYPTNEPLTNYTGSFNVNLTQANEGINSITVYAWAGGGYIKGVMSYEFQSPLRSSTITFRVRDTLAPNISISSLQNAIYTNLGLPLNFTVNEPVSKVTYSLDEQENMTISSNTILANLTSGMHNVTVYGWDAVGNVGSSTVNFTINLPLQTQTLPVSEVIIVASFVLIVATALTIILYKRRRTTVAE